MFYDDSVSPRKLLGSAPLTLGKAKLTLTTLTAGSTHQISAVYGGSVNFAGSSTSTDATVTIDQATTSTGLTTTWTAPVPYGTPESFTATVSNTSGSSAAPTGSVTFYLDSTSTVLGHGTLSGGKATLSNVLVPGGSHQVFAVYAGTSNFVGSTSPNVSVTINPEGTTTSLSDNASGTVSVGTPVTFTIAVSDVDSGLPAVAGSVSLYDNSTGTPKLLATVKLVNGQATYTTSTLKVGSHPIQAVFATTNNYTGSQSSVVTVTVG
jgi:hypothetical protein